jgi:SSS family solute:Na+ symporter
VLLVDWLIVAAYLAFALGAGVVLSKRGGRSTSDFFMAGRSLPWWVVGTSMVATTFAADTPLAITEMVRGHGIWRNWWWWNMALGGMLGVVFFSRLWRRAEVLTDNELIELRYEGRPAAVLRAFKAGWFATVYNFIVMGWVINGMSTVIAVLTGHESTVITWSLVAIAVVYTLLSGFWGVVITDLVQFLLAMAGSLFLAWKAVDSQGGLSSLVGKIRELGAAETLNMVPPVASPAMDAAFLGSPFFTFLSFVLLTWWSSHNADGGGYIIQRMGACRSEADAEKATLWFNFANYALRVWPWVLVALVSMVMFPEIEGGHKLGYPMVLDALLGPVWKGLLVTTFLAAFMSTIDTHLNWGASYVVHDIYRRFVRPDADEAHYVQISRITVLVLIAIAALLSGFMTSIERAWIFVWAMGAGSGSVLILRWFWWRINAWSELTALFSSIVITFALELVAWLQAAPGEYMLFASPVSFMGVTLGTALKALIIVPLSIACWLTVTLLTKPVSDEHLKVFANRVRPPGNWRELRDGPSDLSMGRTILRWAGGMAFVYGSTFSLGKLLLGSPSEWLPLVIVALAGLLLFLKTAPRSPEAQRSQA